jgi:hypothetical protein
MTHRLLEPTELTHAGDSIFVQGAWEPIHPSTTGLLAESFRSPVRRPIPVPEITRIATMTPLDPRRTAGELKKGDIIWMANRGVIAEIGELRDDVQFLLISGDAFALAYDEKIVEALNDEMNTPADGHGMYLIRILEGP